MPTIYEGMKPSICEKIGSIGVDKEMTMLEIIGTIILKSKRVCLKF